MTTYDPPTDLEFATGKPATQTVMRRLRDMFVAFSEGDPTAPRAPFMGMEFITSASLSGTYATFTEFDATIYDSYLFVIRNARASADSRSLYMQTSSDGGSSFDTGGSDYSAPSGDDAAIMLASSVGASTGEDGFSGSVSVMPSSGSLRSYATSVGSYENASGTFLAESTGGRRNSSSAVDAVRFYYAFAANSSFATFSAGTITMYGLRNS